MRQRRCLYCALPVEKNRTYAKALRELLGGLGQYTIVRDMKDERIIRESEVSSIEGKIGYEHLWDVYASYMRRLIEDCEQTEPIKEVMRVLLKTWEEA